jgi:PAS domain S-box-containing protein
MNAPNRFGAHRDVFMRIISRIAGIALAAMFLAGLFSGCSSTGPLPHEHARFASYKNIPGITGEEIKAIEKLKTEYASFVYGMTPTTEAFLGLDGKKGEIQGFSALFCDWLADLFGIPFKPALHNWDDLLDGLEKKKINFTGDLVASKERRRVYAMASPIANRSLKSFRILARPAIQEIAKSRPPKLACLASSPVLQQIQGLVDFSFEAIYANNFTEAYNMLKSGRADALVLMGISEASFDSYSDIASETFFPMVFSPASIATRDDNLSPIISVVQKALNHKGVQQDLINMYEAGYKDYNRNRLFKQLTDAERAYIKNADTIKVGIDPINYPISFYDKRSREWRGIFFDIIKEVESLTGLVFERTNDESAEWSTVYKKLLNGEVAIAPELAHSEEREGKVLWSKKVLMNDYLALVTKQNFPNAKINEIMHFRVGLAKDIHYSSIFRHWFPDHPNTVEYMNFEDAFQALRDGKVDMVMASQKRLLILTHYMEDPSYKPNLMFDKPIEVTMGFSKDEAILNSIVDKALGMIDTEGISKQWMLKTFDYRKKSVEAQLPLLITSIAVLGCALAMIAYSFVKSRRSEKYLERLAHEQEEQLDLQTSTLKTIFDSSPDFIFCKDLEYRYTRCNKSTENFFGLREEDIIGKNDTEAFGISPDAAESFKNEDLQVIREKVPIVFEEAIMSPSTGKSAVVETYKAPLVQEGKVVGIMGISRDITKRKAIENELALQTSTLETIFNSSPDFIFCKDLKSRYTRCNKSTEVFFGIRESEIAGKDDAEAFGFSPETAQAFKDEDQKIIRGKKPIVFEETIMSQSGGKSAIVETFKAPLMKEGEVIGIMGISRDITKRKAIENELTLQTSTLMAVFNSIPDHIFCKDLESRYTRCNKSMEDFFGVREAEIIGQNDFEVLGLPPEMAMTFVMDDKKIMKEMRAETFEEDVISPCRTKYMRAEITKAPLVNNGKLIGLIGISRDITKRKAIENELAMQTSTLTAIFNSIPDLIFCKDLESRYTKCNKSMEDFFGLREADIIGKNDVEALKFPPDLAEEFIQADKIIIKEMKPTHFEEDVISPCRTKQIRTETIKAPLIHDGKVVGLIGIARDITLRKKAENELALQTAKLKAILDSIPDSVFCKDMDLNVIQCNKVMAEFAGLREEDILGRKMSEAFRWPPKLSEQSREADLATLKEGKTNIIEMEVPHLQATRTMETVRAPLFQNGSIVGLIGIARDVTERREMEEAAKAASYSKSRFIAQMSHEIRTPMNSIIGFSELALDSDASPHIKDYLKKILENSTWLLQIINNILDISKIESGKFELEHTPFDLHDLFSSCRSIILPIAIEKGINVHFYAEPSIGKRLLGDPTRLRQVLLNLLTNAVKFTHSGIVKMEATVKEYTSQTSTIHFEVRDSGIGMTTEQLSRVFDQFEQAEKGTTRKYGGTGLGLSIAKNIVGMMGGELAVESTQKVGSKFNFDITFDTIDSTGSTETLPEIVFHETERPVFSGEVLLCEDNKMNQEVVSTHLQKVGLRTVIAENGKEGVDIVAKRKERGEKPFDLIFMDIHMPVMDGLEAAPKIAALKTGAPIVALTANVMVEDRELYIKNGMPDYVGKPFTTQELWRCLLRHLMPLRWLDKDKAPDSDGDGDEKLRSRLAVLFVNNNRFKAKEIAEALAAEDIILAHRLAHTLKGNAGQMGFPSLQKAAQEVESRLIDGKNTVAPKHLSLLEQELGTALKELEPLAAAQEHMQIKEQPKPMTKKNIRVLFAKLAPMLEDGNAECLEFIDSLRQVPGSEALVLQMEQFDFEPALETLNELIKRI